MGARVALDDFGTGFSSLSYLRDYRFDVLKIDRSFIGGLDGGGVNGTTADRDLVASIISLGKILNLDVVAEGVEEKTELDCLARMGCSLIQGYYYAAPMPAVDALAYLEAGELRKVG
jgi:EAL domain-containing protein (putative c-di-GMP-specific phosphodiesterase class I)